jgi:hypothetical protein
MFLIQQDISILYHCDMFVFRFCSKNHEKLESNKGWVVELEKGLGVPHKNVCHLLKTWNNRD